MSKKTMDNFPKPHYPLPSKAQLEYMDMEIISFIHFGPNTYTDKEWGDGTESPTIFNPVNLDAYKWVKSLKDGGAKQVILTAKHHDGFCLWPSKYTEHSVKNSPWKNGQGDVVKEVADACDYYGIKFGVYLSPWDQNSQHYGKGEAYNDFYMNQLEELLNNYGKVCEMWFDGAKGSNVEQSYDMNRWREFILSKNPDMIMFSDAGPQTRWCGNERGIAGEPMWNKVDLNTMSLPHHDIEYLQHGDKNGSNWVCSECDVSIRPGWFYHNHEDNSVKSVEKLLDIYFKSVGRGSVLLLNVPPNKDGEFHDTDIKRLKDFKEEIDKIFDKNLAEGARITASNERCSIDNSYSATNVLDNNKETFWCTDDGIYTGTIQCELATETTFDVISLKEYIALGQRIESFNVEALINEQWVEVFAAETIGHKRLIRINPITTNKLRINILSSQAEPMLSELSIYNSNAKQNDSIDKSIISFNSEAINWKGNTREVSIEVIRSGNLSSKVEIDYTTYDGTAKASIDYQQWSGTICFEEGEKSKTFNINIIDNNNRDLHFFVGLISNQNNIKIGTNKKIKVII